MTYEVGLSRTVRAFHIMPGQPGREGQLHDHDYRIDVVVERERLDERGMVCDLSELEARRVTAAGGRMLAVRVWETPPAFGGYRSAC